jgi:hypothetical protein
MLKNIINFFFLKNTKIYTNFVLEFVGQQRKMFSFIMMKIK